MADTAAHLVDDVLPRVPVRQWLLSFPSPPLSDQDVQQIVQTSACRIIRLCTQRGPARPGVLQPRSTHARPVAVP